MDQNTRSQIAKALLSAADRLEDKARVDSDGRRVDAEKCHWGGRHVEDAFPREWEFGEDKADYFAKLRGSEPFVFTCFCGKKLKSVLRGNNWRIPAHRMQKAPVSGSRALSGPSTPFAVPTGVKEERKGLLGLLKPKDKPKEYYVEELPTGEQHAVFSYYLLDLSDSRYSDSSSFNYLKDLSIVYWNALTGKLADHLSDKEHIGDKELDTIVKALKLAKGKAKKEAKEIVEAGSYITGSGENYSNMGWKGNLKKSYTPNTVKLFISTLDKVAEELENILKDHGLDSDGKTIKA